ncbi:MAG: DUF11 domain-containing protein [Sedimentisphaerales bacterium]|nr:DUF11 domain-containing protein [Sedimentisphaerales bacterium]
MKNVLLLLPLLAAIGLSGCGNGHCLSCGSSCGAYYEKQGLGPVPEEIATKSRYSNECLRWLESQKVTATATPKTTPKVATEPIVAPKPILATKPAPKPAQSASSECGKYIASHSYPCGETGVLLIEKVMPEEVQLNAPFEYTIKVTNHSEVMITQVVVTEHIQEHFKFVSATPKAKEDDGKLIWTFDAISPGDSELINVSGAATNVECLQYCATLTYVVPVCTYVKVVKPQLTLAKTMPEKVSLCDKIPLKLDITNSGNGLARNVKIVDKLPEGLKTADGKDEIVFNVKALEPGKTVTGTSELVATKTGKYVNKAVATADGGLQAEVVATTVVQQPVLAIEKTGPKSRYLGRTVKYEIKVSNKGDGIANNLVIEDKIPVGMKFVGANHNGKLVGDKVVWNLSALAPNASHEVEVTLSSDKEGTYENIATAKAECASSVSASASTAVKGIAAILLEVIDIDDPIELGNNETYVITVTNQGTSDGTNIKIVCNLEENVEYVSASGPTTANVEDRVVTFRPLPKLAPQQKATWRVVVKAVKPGDVRFGVTMNSDQLRRPVEETESTEMYR